MRNTPTANRRKGDNLVKAFTTHIYPHKEARLERGLGGTGDEGTREEVRCTESAIAEE